MRYMMLYKPGKETNTLPSKQEMNAIGKLMEEMANAGVLLETGGLHPSSKGARVKINGGKFSVMDGPFPEEKHLVGGYAIVKANSKMEAIEWAKRLLQVTGEGESEIRPLMEPSEMGTGCDQSTPDPSPESCRNTFAAWMTASCITDQGLWRDCQLTPRSALAERDFFFSSLPIHRFTHSPIHRCLVRTGTWAHTDIRQVQVPPFVIQCPLLAGFRFRTP